MGLFSSKQKTYKDAPADRHDGFPHGQAAFAGPDYKHAGEARSGVHFGQLRTPSLTLTWERGWLGDKVVPLAPDYGPLLYSKPETNSLICAPAGAGKGVSILIPTLLRFEGSVLTIDPKGENTVVTRRAREEMGQTVHILNPWGLHGLPTSRVNPLDLLDRDDPEVVSNATFLTDLCVVSAAQGADRFWDQSSKALIRGLLLYVTGYEPTERRSFGTLRRLVTQRAADLKKTLDVMAASELFGGTLAEAGNEFRDMEERTFQNVISTAQAHTDFLTDPIVKAALEVSDFSFSDLKARPTTAYLIIPAQALTTQGRWLRLMVGTALTAFERGALYDTRCLFLLDEFPALGAMAKVQSGIATLRGYGVDMALVVQDLNQLRSAYGKAADTIISNCHFKHFMKISDFETARYVSDMLGRETVRVRNKSIDSQKRETENWGLAGKPLKSPDELLTEAGNTGFLIKTASPPILLDQKPYFDTPELEALADPHPMFRRS